jgi:Rod binding domain-containing protein
VTNITPAGVTALNTEADKIIRAAATPTVNSKIEKSAKDFESILLGNWLQQAEHSFGSLPGADDDEEDSANQQYQGMATESLGNAMAASGGIGIAKMIAQQLHKAEDARLGAPGTPLLAKEQK